MTHQRVGVEQITERLRADSPGSSLSHRDSLSVTPPGAHPRRVGTHRAVGPSHRMRSRAAVVAVAAGASFAAYQAHTGGMSSLASPEDDVLLLAANNAALGGAPTSGDDVPSREEVTWASPDSQSVVSALYEGQTTNAEREIAEELDRRPDVHAPAMGRITSGYGPRWGAFHGGIDIANEMNSPIFAATDGIVIDSGAAQGYGQWLRVLSDDGVMTVYGHVETLIAKKGERVYAGQHIAGMGNRGFSTGTHLHFEVWINGGTERINPLTWFEQNGMQVESAIGPIQPGAENLPVPGFEGSVEALSQLATQVFVDPVNTGEGAPGLRDSITTTAQSATDPAESRELESIAEGRPPVVAGDPYAAPMGPVIAPQPPAAAAAPTAVPSLGAVAP